MLIIQLILIPYLNLDFNIAYERDDMSNTMINDNPSNILVGSFDFIYVNFNISLLIVAESSSNKIILLNLTDYSKHILELPSDFKIRGEIKISNNGWIYFACECASDSSSGIEIWKSSLNGSIIEKVVNSTCGSDNFAVSMDGKYLLTLLRERQICFLNYRKITIV